MDQRIGKSGAWLCAALLFLSGCGPNVQELRNEFAHEKQKLGDRQRALLEFERFNVDLAGQQRIEEADIDRVEDETARPTAHQIGSVREQDLKYVQTQREQLAAAKRLADETHAKLVEEVKEQQQRVTAAEARLKKAEQ